jgi:hypothetical protein
MGKGKHDKACFYVGMCPMFQKYWMYGTNGGMNPCLFMLF